LALQAEKKKECMNEYQVMVFDFMNSLPLVDNLKDQESDHKINVDRLSSTTVSNAVDKKKLKGPRIRGYIVRR